MYQYAFYHWWMKCWCNPDQRQEKDLVVSVASIVDVCVPWHWCSRIFSNQDSPFYRNYSPSVERGIVAAWQPMWWLYMNIVWIFVGYCSITSVMILFGCATLLLHIDGHEPKLSRRRREYTRSSCRGSPLPSPTTTTHPPLVRMRFVPVRHFWDDTEWHLFPSRRNTIYHDFFGLVDQIWNDWTVWRCFGRNWFDNGPRMECLGNDGCGVRSIIFPIEWSSIWVRHLGILSLYLFHVGF